MFSSLSTFSTLGFCKNAQPPSPLVFRTIGNEGETLTSTALTYTGSGSVTIANTISGGFPQIQISTFPPNYTGAFQFSQKTGRLIVSGIKATANYTFMFWAKISSQIGNRVLVFRVVNGGGTFFFTLWNWDTFGYMIVPTNSPDNPSNLRIPNSPDVWMHCAYVVSGDTWTTYKNGTQVGTGTDAKLTTAVANAGSLPMQLIIGDTLTYGLTGYLCDVRWYNVALDSAQIVAAYNNLEL